MPSHRRHPSAARCAWLALACGLGVFSSAAQSRSTAPRLDRDRMKAGADFLRTFQPVVATARQSVVKIDADGNTVALATVVAEGGLAVTKASELTSGRLTAWLPNGREVSVERLAQDDDNDLALLRVHAERLPPIRWATQIPAVGQWVASAGTAESPQAVGIVSVPARRILPQRALLGVQLDWRSQGARIQRILDGMGAQSAGLQAGDAILSLNGQEVDEPDALIQRLREFRDGQSVTLRVRRADHEFDARVTLRSERDGAGPRRPDRAAEMERLGSVLSNRAEGFTLALQHDTVLQNWQCGGPLLNLDGAAVGVNIARAGRVASYALPASLVQRLVASLQERLPTPPAK